jgi:hypothetical protein
MEERRSSWNRAISTRIAAGLDKLVWVLSIYIVPIAIAMVSVVALFVWQDQYAANGSDVIELQALVDPTAKGSLSPEQASTRLDSEPLLAYFETKRSEKPVWFAFDGSAGGKGKSVIGFPSRHATRIACWDRTSLSVLGEATRSGAQGAVSLAKAGFEMQLRPGTTGVLCQAQFVGPARLSAEAWIPIDARRTTLEFHRNSGLLDGGLIVLAVFVLMTAWINRQILYVLFAAWLVVTLRMSAQSAGWDTQWLGHSIPADWP